MKYFLRNGKGKGVCSNKENELYDNNGEKRVLKEEEFVATQDPIWHETHHVRS